MSAAQAANWYDVIEYYFITASYQEDGTNYDQTVVIKKNIQKR